MVSRYGLLVIALGLTLPLQTLAQELTQPALEGEPIASPRQEESATTSEEGGAPEESSTAQIISAIQSIESAIRELIADESESEREWQQEKEIRDLNAQEEMALWAKRMFWASVASVIVTFFALIAIIVTLIHTRRAADAADGMLKQIKVATDAARETVDITRDIGQAQVRAYPVIAEVQIGHSQSNNNIWISIKIDNRGNSPALEFDLVFRLKFFFNNTFHEIIVQFDCGGLDTDGNRFGPIQFNDKNFLSADFQSSAALHVEVAWFALDIFKKQTSGYGYYTIGGNPIQTYQVTSSNKIPVGTPISVACLDELRQHRYKGKI